MRNNDHLTAQGAIFARLDKRTRRRVMCGKLNSSGEQTCEGEFGVIEENDDIGHDDGELNRRLWLGGIFVYNVDKNGWHPSRHAVARIRDAQREYYREHITWNEFIRRSQPRFRRGHTSPLPWEFGVTPTHDLIGVYSLPCLAICPTCHIPNILHQIVLGINDPSQQPESEPDGEALRQDYEQMRLETEREMRLEVERKV